MQRLSNRGQAWLAILVVIGFLFAVFYVLTMPDRRTSSEKVGDAFNELGDGVEDAGRQLQDRTPAEKIGDAIEDASEQ